MADHDPSGMMSPARRCRREGGCRGHGVMRLIPVRSLFPAALPITPEEIHKVLAALGPDLAALFEEDG